MSVSAADMASPAMACLRVSIHGMPEGQNAPDLQVLVAKLINAFLETRWQFPRRFEQMTPYAFVLSDPKAAKMDRRALKALAAELQLKLFGADGDGDGEVSLLVFEGSDVEVHRFARLPGEDVDRFMDGEALDPPFEGRADRISAARKREGRADNPVRAAIDKARAPGPDVFGDLEFGPSPQPAPPPPQPHQRTLDPLFSALYMTGSQSFVGNVVLCRRPGSLRTPSLIGPTPIAEITAEAFDEGCVDSAVWALSRGAAGGLLFVPLSFSSLVRPAGRRTYARFLCHLPAEHKARLGAAIYDTPRDPSFFALSTIRRFLEAFVGEINLHVTDPDFEIAKLQPGAVSSVTLVLPDREPKVRIAAVRRFLESREVYKNKRVWPGVGPVADAAELEACLTLRAPVVSGPAVAKATATPVASRKFELDRLPLF
jgi:hypothetical protein